MSGRVPWVAIVRWAIGAFLVGWGFHRLATMDTLNLAAGFGVGLICFAAVIAGVIFIVPEVVVVVCRPALGWIEDLYTGNTRARRPPLDFRLSDHYEKRARYGDLVEELTRISGYYPREVRPYQGLVDVFARFEPDPARLRSTLRRARWRLPRKEFYKLKLRAREQEAEYRRDREEPAETS